MARKKESTHASRRTPFGRVLYAACTSEFGTIEEFAKSAGHGPSWVSHAVTGEHETSPGKLAQILKALRSEVWRERVRDAWIEEHVPAVPRISVAEIGEREALAQARELWFDDRPRRALEIVAELRSVARDARMWTEATEHVVQIGLGLGSHGLAAGAVAELERRARARSEPLDMLTSLWMRGTVLRNAGSVPFRELRDASERAIGYAGAHRPAADVRDRWRKKVVEIHRDLALDILAANDRRAVGREGLEEAMRHVEHALALGEEPDLRGLGLEVKARVQAALGSPFEAEETLEEAVASAKRAGSLHQFRHKTQILRARIALARNDRALAAALLEEAASESFRSMNLHHYRVANDLLTRLMAREP